jgi:hypothetical protein
MKLIVIAVSMYHAVEGMKYRHDFICEIEVIWMGLMDELEGLYQ